MKCKGNTQITQIWKKPKTSPSNQAKGCLSLFNYFIDISPTLKSPLFAKKTCFFDKKWTHFSFFSVTWFHIVVPRQRLQVFPEAEIHGWDFWLRVPLEFLLAQDIKIYKFKCMVSPKNMCCHFEKDMQKYTVNDYRNPIGTL